MLVLSCAGAYVSGAAGSNACPAGSARIETEAACLTAVAAAGMTVGSVFVMTISSSPRGCYYFTSDNEAYFNTHAVGAGVSGTKLLCATVTTGAPPPPLCDARTCIHRRVHRRCASVRVYRTRTCAMHRAAATRLQRRSCACVSHKRARDRDGAWWRCGGGGGGTAGAIALRVGRRASDGGAVPYEHRQ